ncbi:hypothetical protein CK203_111438 [Vitis vinifera]|uniref:Uncharacterized protein n=1 Tax=Vitis vinifera TaxID=29760 RepID=A0A438CBI4_VITVI|nr:hypothetical protein CK203_111438 [Vitis vinifera]
MAALLYFEEKVHKKKLQRANTIPLLFPRLLYHILEHISYPTEPHLKRRHHCREHFTLNQWTQLANFIPPAPAAPSMPEATSTDPPATYPVPPAAPPTSEAPINISAMEFRAMIHLFKTLTATHNIQKLLGLSSPPQTDISRASEPIAPPEETIRVDVPPQTTHEATTEPSSPPENPAT